MENSLNKKLNKREQYKARLKPFDYFSEFDTIDFESLGEGDRYYLQDFGIFNTNFLEDEFTLRLRNAGGRITTSQFSFLAQVVESYNLTLVITARGAFQLHDVEAQDVKELWYKLNSNGLSTWQSFGDNVRNIVTDIYDGVSLYGKIEVQPIINQMQEYILKNPTYVGMLPRRVSIGISGNSANVNSFFANDIYFALAKKDAVYGFNVYLGGKNSEVAKDADIFLKKEEVFLFFKAFVKTFYKHGSRFSRSKTRFFYMLEELGMSEVLSLIEGEYKNSFVSAGESESQYVHFKEFETLKNNTYSYCYQSDFGRLTPTQMKKIALFCNDNKLSIRIGIDQNIYLLGLKEKSVPFQEAALSSTIVACAGNLCPYAVWSIKDETSYLPLEQIDKHRITIGFSGCAKGCGRHRHTDIGLIGLKTNNFGDTEGGARIFIGATHMQEVKVSRELFSMVPFVHLKNVMSLIIRLYEKSNSSTFEAYTLNILDAYSQDFLALWHLYNLKNKTELTLEKHTVILTQEEEERLLQNTFPQEELIENSFKKSVSVLVKLLWSVEGKDPHYKPPIKRVKFR